MRSEQEDFWAGCFGDEYCERNIITDNIGSAISLFSTITRRVRKAPLSILEIGCNVGINLAALRAIFPSVSLYGIEINKKAAMYARVCCTPPPESIYNCSVFEYGAQRKFDFVFTSGVLIHINPDLLNNMYEKIYYLSNSYICVNEYYNPTPVEVSYRGNENKLFKRDFAGELLDMYEDLELIDYGFVYHRDTVFPRDDSTWFLLRKIEQ